MASKEGLHPAYREAAKRVAEDITNPQPRKITRGGLISDKPLKATDDMGVTTMKSAQNQILAGDRKAMSHMADKAEFATKLANTSDKPQKKFKY